MSFFQVDDTPADTELLSSSDLMTRVLSRVPVENEFVKGVYNKIASAYDFTFGPTLHAGRLEAIERLPLKPGDDVLEVGVGTGINATLYPRHCSITGIDFSVEMLEKAGRRLAARNIDNVRLLQMDAAELDFPDESFDVVYAPYVISVVHDPVKVAKEMSRCAGSAGMSWS